MPHMMPMLWTLIFMMSFILLFLLLILIYFFHMPLLTISKKPTLKYKWTWMW